MSKVISFWRENGSITFFQENGETVSMTSDHPKWIEAVKLVKQNRLEEAAELATINDMINTFENTGVSITSDGRILLNGSEVSGDAAEYLLQQYRDGFPLAGLPQFIERLNRNPSNRVHTELFTFLRKAGFPITPDGRFYAYKKVSANYLDLHSGTMSNAPGTVASMPRNRVNEDPNQTCAPGLHVCAYSYLPYFGRADGDRILKVLVDPEDVVSIPYDYNHAKMRTCKYVVVEDITEEASEDILRRTVELGDFDPTEYLEEEDDLYNQVFGRGYIKRINAEDEWSTEISDNDEFVISYGPLDVLVTRNVLRQDMKSGVIDID